MISEGEETGAAGKFVSLAYRACNGLSVDKHELVQAAVAVMDTLPADRDAPLFSLADHMCQAAMDFAYFDAPLLRLQNAVRGFYMAASGVEADAIMNWYREGTN